MTVPAEVLAGIRLFNEGEYFEAHEAWEDHWGMGGPAERGLTLGLIKAAVALHHLEAENAVGFTWQAEQALPHLRLHHAVWPELQIDAFADAIESLLAQYRFHGRIVDPEPLPTLPLPP